MVIYGIACCILCVSAGTIAMEAGHTSVPGVQCRVRRLLPP